MEYWASFAIVNFFVVLSMFFIQNIKPKFKDKKNYICYFICLVLFILNFEFSVDSLRIAINCLIYILLAYLLFKSGLKKAFILGVMIVCANLLMEIIYAGVSYPLINHTLFFANSALTVFMQNSIIGIMLFAFCCFLGRINYYNKVLVRIEKIKTKQVIVFSLLSVIVFNLFIWVTYFASSDLFNSPALSFVGSAISLFSVVLVFTYLKTNNKYVDISEKYNVSLENIRNYEQIIDSNRVNNHEIRNQFLMLRNMSRNKKMTTYIDSILNNKLSDSEELLNEVIRIPSGGLRGLIYTKLLSMKEQNIDYELHVDKKINVRKINKIDSDCMVDICKVIGVFLDNAIDAVKELDEKNITVELYADRKDIVISITNNFSGYIDVENLDKSGYTTKSAGHGYGLRLVRYILSKNEQLENYKEIYEDNFTQNLKIKM